MKTKKSPIFYDKTLLREHYMKMKKFNSFLLQSKCTSLSPSMKRNDAKHAKVVVWVGNYVFWSNELP